MAIDSILAQIDAEIARLTQARSLLANLGTVNVAAATIHQQGVPEDKEEGRRGCSALKRASGLPMRSASAGPPKSKDQEQVTSSLIEQL